MYLGLSFLLFLQGFICFCFLEVFLVCFCFVLFFLLSALPFRGSSSLSKMGLRRKGVRTV